MNRRREPRNDYLARVVISYRDEGGSEIEMPAMIEDRSKSGLGVRVRKSIAPGSSVRVQQGSRLYIGVERRCLPYNLDYFIGIELQPENGAGDRTSDSKE